METACIRFVQISEMQMQKNCRFIIIGATLITRSDDLETPKRNSVVGKFHHHPLMRSHQSLICTESSTELDLFVGQACTKQIVACYFQAVATFPRMAR